MSKKLILISVYIILVTLSVVLGQDAKALQMDQQCADVEMIFARGSGQSLNEGEATRFFKQLEARIPIDKISYNIYELGTETYGGHKYPAVKVTKLVGLGAWVSAGYANDYGKSVDFGVGELYNYLTQRHDKCKSNNTKFVLGGYSQGAQVVGQTLPKFSETLRQDIVFAALFGDPKLYLPEGVGQNPPACQGKQLSDWRRIIGDCKADNGSLGARKPYLPDDMKDKTGLWCYADDFFCGTSKNVNVTSGHYLYKAEKHAIDIAAGEIALRLSLALPKEQAEFIGVDVGNGTGTAGLDVVFVFDTTGSMSGQIESTKEFIRSSAAKIYELRGRVALTVFKDQGDEYTAQILSGFHSTPDDLLTKLDTVQADGGGDTPEASLHALMTSFNGLEWKNGATKAAILLTDAPFHNPDLVDGSTIESVTKRSLEIDPVNVYPVVSSDVAEYYTELARMTSGQVVPDSGDTVAALQTALTKIEQRPTPLLKNTHYSAEPGQEITFDASDSYVVDATITEYAWDINGDGEFEHTGTTPVFNHTYREDFDGTMQVRLTASNGTVANASAFVKIGAIQPPATPAQPTNLKVETIAATEQSRTVRLIWNPADARADSWLVSMNGVALGRTTASQTSLEITDVPTKERVSFTVAGVLADGTVGEEAEIALNAIEAPAPPTPQPPQRPWWQLLLEYVIKLVRGWKFG